MKFIKLTTVYGSEVRINAERILALEAIAQQTSPGDHTRVHVGAGDREFFCALETPAIIERLIRKAR